MTQYQIALNEQTLQRLFTSDRERPERVAERMRWEVSLSAVACDTGEKLS
jgi:hypothetical protein